MGFSFPARLLSKCFTTQISWIKAGSTLKHLGVVSCCPLPILVHTWLETKPNCCFWPKVFFFFFQHNVSTGALLMLLLPHYLFVHKSSATVPLCGSTQACCMCAVWDYDCMLAPNCSSLIHACVILFRKASIMFLDIVRAGAMNYSSGHVFFFSFF